MKPFRFALSLRDAYGVEPLRAAVGQAASAGFDTVVFADHLGAAAPMVMATAAAAVSDELRIGTHVLSNDFRHPALLAHEAATVDIMSGGRFELGIGAGWALDEYAAAGIAFDRGGARVARLEESLQILRGLFAGEAVTHFGNHYRTEELQLEPLPAQPGGIPILVGGNGDRLLRVAGRHADIVQFTGFTHTGTDFDTSNMSEAGLAGRIDVVQRVAGDRFDHLELGVLVQRVVVTDDADAEVAAVAARGVDEQTVRTSPHMLIGTAAEIAHRCRQLRERHGISYFTMFQDRCDGVEAVIAELAGT